MIDTKNEESINIDINKNTEINNSQHIENYEEKNILISNQKISEGNIAHTQDDLIVMETLPKISESSYMVSKLTKILVQALVFGLIVSLTIILIVAAAVLLSQYRYINKSLTPMCEKGACYYIDSQIFPVVGGAPDEINLVTLTKNLPKIKSFGVKTIILKSSTIENTIYSRKEDQLKAMVTSCHEIGISILFSGVNIGYRDSTDPWVTQHPNFFYNDMFGNKYLFNYGNTSVFEEIFKLLFFYTKNGVDGFIFSDLPRIITNGGKNIDFDVPAIVNLKKKLKSDLNPFAIEMLLDVVSRLPGINSFPENKLSGIIYTFNNSIDSSIIGMRQSLQAIWKNLDQINESIPKLFTSSSFFVSELESYPDDFVKIIASLSFLPGMLVIKSGLEYKNTKSSISFDSLISNLSDEQIKFYAEMKAIIDISANYDSDRYLMKTSDIAIQNDVLVLIKSKKDGEHDLVVLLWNEKTVTNTINMTAMANIPTIPSIKLLFSTESALNNRVTGEAIVTLFPKELLILKLN